MYRIRLNKILCTVLVLLLYAVMPSKCLYEDQVSKFDWMTSFVGQMSHLAHSNQYRTHQSLVMTTNSGALASIFIRNGSVHWRHVLESDIDAVTSGPNDCHIMTINGNANWVRCWASDGVLQSEMSVSRDYVDHIQRNIKDYRLFYNLKADKKEVTIAKFSLSQHSVEITKFDLITQTIKTTSTPISTSNWFTSETSCSFVTDNYLICVDDRDLVMQFLVIGESKSFIGVPLSSFGLQATVKPKYLRVSFLSNQHNNDRPYFAVNLGGDGYILLRIRQNQIDLIKIFPEVVALSLVQTVDSVSYTVCILTSKPNPTSAENEAYSAPTTGLKLSAFNIENWDEVESLSGQFILDSQVFVDKLEIIPIMRNDNKYYYKVLISTEDATLIMTNIQGKISWRREEALADIVSAEILDLPLSELDAKIEQTFSFDKTNIISQFITRISTQIYQLQAITSSLVTHLIASITQKPNGRNLVEDNNDDEFSDSGESLTKASVDVLSTLVRDKFGLHKIIISLSKNGKLFGLDSFTAQIIWSIYEPNLRTTDASNKIAIWVQRTTAHYPYPAQCTVVNKNGFILSFDPITGEVFERIKLEVRVTQTMLLSHFDNTYLKPILILDDEMNPIIYPSSAKSLFLNLNNVYYMLYADEKSGLIRGLSFTDSDETELKAKQVWSIELPLPISALQVVFKRLTERVHSQGRVMGDRSVLYKYLNPNLVAIIYESIDSQEKPFVNLFMVDAITGAIIFTTAHKRAKGPLHIVHSENWVIYSYYNEKSRRTEISSIELYEGTTQSNSSAFSSLSRSEMLPAIVEQQTYIFPTGIEVMANTITERGITNKHILIVLPSGGLLELSKAFLDPRRPINPTLEHREEGLIPYIPEIPIPPESIINYNKSLYKVRGIQTEPTNLESTCLVFAYGLDLFYTRVTPSKTFDILKDDFDFLLILAVLIAIISVSYLVKWLAARKTLNSAWK